MTKERAVSLESHLLAYATAASAAGVGILGLASSCEAKVIFTPSNQAITSGMDFPLDLNNDGIADFIIHNLSVSSTPYCHGYLAVRGAQQGNKALKSQGYAAALPPGSRIGGADRFGSNLYMLRARWSRYYSGIYYGPWKDADKRYLGVKFQINGANHYGWVRMSVSEKYTCDFTGTLSGYAFETVSDRSIVTGPTTGGVGLGGLALGSTGKTKK